jgi:hypothetical protein
MWGLAITFIEIITSLKRSEVLNYSVDLRPSSVRYAELYEVKRRIRCILAKISAQRDVSIPFK